MAVSSTRQRYELCAHGAARACLMIPMAIVTGCGIPPYVIVGATVPSITVVVSGLLADDEAEPAANNTTQKVDSRPLPVLQSVVRGAYGHFRDCYEDALDRTPNLRGRVTVRFIITEAGDVLSVRAVELPEGGPLKDELLQTGLYTTLPDDQVTTCLVWHYKRLKFPRNDGGLQHVIWPIKFDPEANEAEPSVDVKANRPNRAATL